MKKTKKTENIYKVSISKKCRGCSLCEAIDSKHFKIDLKTGCSKVIKGKEIVNYVDIDLETAKNSCPEGAIKVKKIKK